MSEDKRLKWQKDFETFYPIYNSFIIDGFIDDDQFYFDDEGKIHYCSLPEYFDKIYTNHEESEQRRRVIIYDITESEEKRFKICDDSCMPWAEQNLRNGEGNNSDDDFFEGGDDSSDIGSLLTRRFFNILNNDEFDNLLIDHRASGVSLDFSRIHYAVTEPDRIDPCELSEELRRDFDKIFNNDSIDEPSGYLFVIKMASRLLSRDGDSNGLHDEELMAFRQLLNIAQSLDSSSNPDSVTKNHKIVILANKLSDLPKWFTDQSANPYIKQISVDRPSEENKLDFFQEMIDSGECFTENFIEKYNEIDTKAAEKSPTKRNSVEKKFLAYTNEFGIKMLRKYREYLKNNPLDDPEKISFSINTFRLGDMKNPWDNEETMREMLNIQETVGRKIKGQSHALASAQTILSRAALGIDRAENPNAPRVVLFLAGPTGTGKTEICKQIAECVFGSEDRMVRFDMSEYGQEESDQKLFGAPPGYIGYDEGGKLTNAIKKEPFSLVLFDEIEKAHNSILDKFLQIIGDGRLTDGKGETVRFTDCIIVITSNAGVTPLGDKKQEEIDAKMGGHTRPSGHMDMKVVAELEAEKEREGKVDKDGKLTKEANDEIYEKVREHLRYNLKTYFNCQLGRPELYGRIEDSIVYYNYIGRDVVIDIARSKVKDVIKSTKEQTKAKDIVCPPEVLGAIANHCQDINIRGYGARGIIKSTGKLFSGSLAQFLSPYYLKTDGMSLDDLKGKTLICSHQGEGESLTIKWDLANE